MADIANSSEYSDIDIKIKNKEYHEALVLVKARFTSNTPLEEQCRLRLFQAWIHYVIESYPNAVNYCHMVLQNRENIDEQLVIDALIIRALVHMKQFKYSRSYDSIAECLRIDPNNKLAISMMELLKMKIMES